MAAQQWPLSSCNYLQLWILPLQRVSQYTFQLCLYIVVPPTYCCMHYLLFKCAVIYYFSLCHLSMSLQLFFFFFFGDITSPSLWIMGQNSHKIVLSSVLQNVTRCSRTFGIFWHTTFDILCQETLHSIVEWVFRRQVSLHLNVCWCTEEATHLHVLDLSVQQTRCFRNSCSAILGTVWYDLYTETNLSPCSPHTHCHQYKDVIALSMNYKLKLKKKKEYMEFC